MNGKRLLLGASTLWVLVMALGACDSEAPFDPRTPNFVLKDLDGNNFELAQQNGKVVVLNFFRTTCGDCQAETPEFVEVYEAYKDSGLVVVGVSGEPVDALKQFADTFNVPYPILHDSAYVYTTTPFGQGGYGVTATPTTVLVGRDGFIYDRYDNRPLSKEELIFLIRQLL